MNKLTNINTITLFLTNRCNANCSYCWEYYKGDTDLDSNLLSTILHDYLSNNESDRTLCLYGGEPTLNREALKVVADVVTPNDDITITMASNLLKLDQELLALFIKLSKSTNFNVTVSLDAFKEVNDETRLESYDVVLKHAKILKEHGVDVLFNTVITNKLLSYIKDHKLDEITFEFEEDLAFNPLTESLHMSNSYDVDLLEYLLELYYFKNGNQNQIISKIYNAIFGVFIDPILCTNKCYGGTKDITILADGKVLSCVKESNILGSGISYNEYDPSNNIIFRNNIGSPNEYVSEYTKTKCKECPITENCIICDGINKQWTGDINTVPTWQCKNLLALYEIWAKYHYKSLVLVYYYMDKQISNQIDLRNDIYNRCINEGGIEHD